MTQYKTATRVCRVALPGWGLVPGAKANYSNRQTVTTFIVPAEIPGVHIVQIFSKDERSVLANQPTAMRMAVKRLQ